MKKLITSTLSLATLITALILGGSPVFSQSVVDLSPPFQPDPLLLQGTSGGEQHSSNCGNISATPNHVIQLNNDFPYLRFSLQSSGQPTLLMRLPNGKTSCISADRNSGRIDAPGYWEQGSYAIYVGDRDGGKYSYTLSITQQRISQ